MNRTITLELPSPDMKRELIKLPQYPGGKSAAGVYQAIINQQPTHGTYIELFLGHGGVLRRKRPAPVNIGVEIDSAVIATWIDAAGRIVTKGDTTMELIGADAFSFLSRQSFHDRVLIYIDPPYLPHPLLAQPPYRHNLTFTKHEALLATIQRLPCMVQISGYDSALYNGALKGWRKIEFPAMTRGGPRTECLWMNYPEPKTMHTTWYAGATFREREGIRRKRDRWIKRLSAMDEIERYIIQSAILELNQHLNPASPDRNRDVLQPPLNRDPPRA